MVYSEYLWIVIVGGVVSMFIAYGIGANEVANCFGERARRVCLCVGIQLGVAVRVVRGSGTGCVCV